MCEDNILTFFWEYNDIRIYAFSYWLDCYFLKHKSYDSTWICAAIAKYLYTAHLSLVNFEWNFFVNNSRNTARIVCVEVALQSWIYTNWYESESDGPKAWICSTISDRRSAQMLCSTPAWGADKWEPHAIFCRRTCFCNQFSTSTLCHQSRLRQITRLPTSPLNSPLRYPFVPNNTHSSELGIEGSGLCWMEFVFLLRLRFISKTCTAASMENRNEFSAHRKSYQNWIVVWRNIQRLNPSVCCIQSVWRGFLTLVLWIICAVFCAI